ncbi:MAG: type VI secretion system baseplate subunit TssE [Gemmatimonadetes bacterium]|nr:type VI secretion system baseplate subunit TssE [Gemmatimonadota bacterium]NNF38039.1 type VI secretion system baseplate subunit TssE [Gemmatimonadota bacterium]NNK63101.1 type VI secretion system baseplate subunit TssE [Gemmatimonadota bacterium]
MDPRNPDLALRPSVIDRLLGAAGPAGPGTDPAGSVAMMKAAVLRDLNWLLNTRRIYTGAGEGRPELAKSLYTYGLADVTSLARGSTVTANLLARDLTEAIRLFEPRLSHVRVTVRTDDDPNSRVLRFLVEAMLDIDPEPMPIAFDTKLEVGGGSFAVDAENV